MPKPLRERTLVKHVKAANLTAFAKRVKLASQDITTWKDLRITFDKAEGLKWVRFLMNETIRFFGLKGILWVTKTTKENELAVLKREKAVVLDITEFD